MRGMSEEENLKTIEIAAKYLNKGVCAIDLAGAEDKYPLDKYLYLFNKAKEKNIPFTIHAGENGSASEVEKAINIGATRIGHGIHSIESNEVLELIKKNNILLEISEDRLAYRYELADKELQKMGLSFDKLLKMYPEKAAFLFKKMLEFHECRYNITGKYLLYMNYESFLHIYLRHVKELAVENQFSERSRFQLDEKDLKYTMNIVLRNINKEYQKFKDENPNKRFFRKGNMAYYYNGDYYEIDVASDGRLASFYKRTSKKL
jgi:hypothetical protein